MIRSQNPTAPYDPIRTFFFKTSGRELMLPKNDRIASWQFKKKSGSVADDSQKRAGRELAITKKVRIDC
jgi:hypothetical protein